MPLWTKNVSANLLVGAGASAIQFTAITAGTGGNSITITIVVSGTGTSLSVAVASSAITINLATNSGGVATSTVNDVVTAVNGYGPSAALVVADKGCVGAGLGLVGALIVTHLTGGINQSAPNWQDAVPSADGWRSSSTYEQLVVGTDTLETIPTSQATVQKSYLVSSEGGDTHYKFGNVADKIVLAVEYDKPVYKVRQNAVDGSGNAIILAGDYMPANITVNLINPGPSNTLNGSYKIINFNDQLVITINLGTNGGGSVTTTNTQLNAFCVTNKIPYFSNETGSSAVTPAVLTGPWTKADTAPTIPITIGENTRALTFMKNLGFQKSLTNQSDDFSSDLPVANFSTLLFGYTVVEGDAATAGEVQIGTGATTATYEPGAGGHQILFTANELGAAGNGIYVVLSAPISVNVAAISSALSTTIDTNDTITYTLKTHNGVAANYTFGSAGHEIEFSAGGTGTAGDGTHVVLAGSVHTNNPTLSSSLSTTSHADDTITYNLVTSGATADSYRFGTGGGSDAYITFTAKTLGASSGITVTIATGVTEGVVTTGSAVVVTLNTGTSTPTSVIATCAADSTTNALVSVSSTDPSDLLAAHTIQSLAGGTNSTISTTNTLLAAFVATDPNTPTVYPLSITAAVVGASGTLAAATIQALASGANAATNTIISDLVTFAATDPNTADVNGIGLTVSAVSGDGAASLAGASSQHLTSGTDATVTITYADGTSYWTDEQDNLIADTFDPVYTPNVTVN